MTRPRSTLSSDRHIPGPADLAAAARAAGVRDERLLAAMAKLPRAVFVPDELAGSAYLDEPIRITHLQVTTQPSLVAKMIEALALGGDEKVLEVGTGYGYQTALLGMLAREVWSIELWQDMIEAARASLKTVEVTNATLLVAPGSRGGLARTTRRRVRSSHAPPLPMPDGGSVATRGRATRRAPQGQVRRLRPPGQ